MKTVSNPIPLATDSSKSRWVKSASLLLFRGLRAAAEAAMEVPGIVEQAVSDVREAWEESSRPNE